jgi:hypothetical protein
MMKTKNTIEAEIDAIRDKIYEQIKDMGPEELCDYINDRGMAIAKEHGIKFKRPPRYYKVA